MESERVLSWVATGIFLTVITVATVWFVLYGPQNGPARSDRQPEFMVAAAHPLAVEAGLDVLRRGGSAMDAAVSVQLVLGLVEPQSSGIGGGAYLLYWDESAKRLHAYDGRETTPMKASPSLFLDETGAPIKRWPDAMTSGRAVGTPSVIALLSHGHGIHGRLPWSELFPSAIRHADQGFAVTPRLNGMISRDPMLIVREVTRNLYYLETADGVFEPLAVGATLHNPAYAQSLKRIAEGGADGFYQGPIAQSIVSAVNGTPYLPGSLSLDDLAAYEVKERDALCRPYRRFNVCTMPPSSSGGITTLSILGILENFDMDAVSPGSTEAVHLITEASRLAFADRDLYVGDDDFVEVPVDGLLDRDYLAARAALIDQSASMGPSPLSAGNVQDRATELAPDRSVSRPGTSHFSIVDADGNVVSMTTSVEGPFGSHLMAGGFILNNQLTDFSFIAEKDGRPVANAVAPGKRPRSSMSPTIVFDENGAFYAVIGSPGGGSIIAYVAQTLIALLDWEMDMQSAISLPRHVNRNGPLLLEAGTPLEAIKTELEDKGHTVVVRPINSGLHGIRITDDGYDGGADPRREGLALVGRPGG